MRYWIAVATGLVLVLTGLAAGIPTLQSEDTCHRVTAICHGLPVGDTCYGVTETERSIVEDDSCERTDTIRQQCMQARNLTCRQDGVTGMAWAEKTRVFDLPCRRWMDAYDLDLPACQ